MQGDGVPSQKQADIGLTWGLGTYKTGMTHKIDDCVGMYSGSEIDACKDLGALVRL